MSREALQRRLRMAAIITTALLSLALIVCASIL